MSESAHSGPRLWRFHGGVNLEPHKASALAGPIVALPVSEKLYIASDQASGQPSPIAVKSGQRVLGGQALTLADHQEVPVHAPTSGVIKEITRGPVPSAPPRDGTRITLVADGRGETIDPAPLANPYSQSPDAIAEHVRRAGVAGLGGALFPTHRKIGSTYSGRINTLVVNGAECEPYISCDEILMRERADAVVRGASLAAHALGAPHCIIAIEDRSPGIQKQLQDSIALLAETEISVVPVPTIYPEGGERQLVQVLTGMEVPAGRYPPDIGLACLNVATVSAMDLAITQGLPLTRRIVTLTGNGVHRQNNFEVPLGTLISDLVNHAGGYQDCARRLVMGGPMMGLALPHDQYPVTKATNCILVLDDAAPDSRAAQMPCIRCAACVPVCPAQLLPHELFWQIQAQDLAGAQAYALSDCIECGCCAYVCPSHIPLVDYYRFAKSAVAVEQSRAQNARSAEARWQAHESRDNKARDVALSNMAKLDRQVTSDQAATDPIAAVLARAKAKRQGQEK